MAALLLLSLPVYGQVRPNPPRASASTNHAILLAVEGTNAWVARRGSTTFQRAVLQDRLFVGDRLRTGERTRASVLMFGKSITRLHEETDLTIAAAPSEESPGIIRVLKGILYLLHRGRPGELEFQTVTVSAGTRGTEFNLEVEEASGRMTLSLFEGEAELRNTFGPIHLVSGEQGVAAPGAPPEKSPILNAANIVQWCLYYPGVLDPAELDLQEDIRTALQDSLSAYARGDLVLAAAAYPRERVPASDAEKVYLGAVLLSVGAVARTEALLNSIGTAAAPAPRNAILVTALRRLIDVVRNRDVSRFDPATVDPAVATHLATVALVESYVGQARADLRAALAAARRATALAPDLGFTWARVAELEFSQGRIGPAQRALDTALALSPRNAQALALRGFLLAARGRELDALASFDQALAIDGGLGNAWLGRGLCRIRRGDLRGGREDLQVAATVEPRRSLLRSYLGKAFSEEADLPHARNELALARQLDSRDPTPWLYSALILQQENRINEAIDDLENSVALNDQRRLYRSRLLLDQDRAVRGVHLANLYRDAGLTDWGARAAVRAVHDDYANYSAHVFLADSYNELRDPNQINLRYETSWLSEYLLANLLAPVGAGTLSQTVSQQEYSRLFERDRLGFASAADFSSRGDWSMAAVQHGTLGSSSYALEGLTQWRRGNRPNNRLEQLALDFQFKQQLGSQDGLYFLVRRDDLEAGDVTPYYRPSSANRGLRVEDRREPTLLAGYHHQWQPGVHTLILAGRLAGDLEVSNPSQETIWRTSLGGSPFSAQPIVLEQAYRSRLEIYSGEIQHLWQQARQTLILGGRAQGGDFQTGNRQRNSTPPTAFSISQDLHENFLHLSAYAYEQWRLWPELLAVMGLSYARNEFPVNYRHAPLAPGESTEDRWSPKAGLIWTPAGEATIRAGYARGLGGVSLEQSFRLEPSQVAGFNQSFRSLIPESEAGAQASPTFDLWGLALEQALPGRLYLALSGEWLESAVDRDFGTVELDIPGGYSAGHTREALDYRERSVMASLHQRASPEWTIGAAYRLSYAELDRRYQDIPASIASGFRVRQDLEALLHHARLTVTYNNAAGYFGSFEGMWYRQDNRGYNGARPGDDFWQWNLYAGYRFARRRVELRCGLLNLADRDYRLNPLNLVNELPRERTFTAAVRLNF